MCAKSTSVNPLSHFNVFKMPLFTGYYFISLSI